MPRTMLKVGQSLILLLGLLHAVLVYPQTAPKLNQWGSVGQPAILYDAPSKQAKPLFIAPAGMPVEVLLTLNAFVKVRDAEGSVAWLEKPALSTLRTVVTRQATSLYSAANESASITLSLGSGVWLEWLDSNSEGAWLKVRYRSASGSESGVITGYLKKAAVWGY
ncbi:SH3 domain-containing protein [Parvibium lacunae]|uniref:SH3 domain-containing protein n=1 Tax=Parvibium lacunae TaxID=1888893 RepID=A0A368L0K1_9BURK|nr:SH3 domain-containing protein [Parvibium lacunae]RCS57066.1 hypothetical protein DU000_09680 [Parvibium lacunae]